VNDLLLSEGNFEEEKAKGEGHGLVTCGH